VNSNLFLKFFGGSKLSLLHLSRERLTNDVDQASAMILKALQRAGVATSRDYLTLKLRRFEEGSPIVDGIFSAPGGLGYFMFAPPDMRAAEAESFMRKELNAVPFFHTHRDGDATRLFIEPVLPRFPELPMPVTVIWSAGEISPVSHGH
jgi:hypothetical protein